MEFDGLMSWLLRTALNGQGVSIHPNLVGNLNVSNPAILRIENFPVYIQVTVSGADRTPANPDAPPPPVLPPPLTLEDPRDGKVHAASSVAPAEREERDRSEERPGSKQRQVRLDLAPVRYRLYPHLVFDDRGRGRGENELEIAPWVKVVVFGDVEHVDFTTLGARRSKQRVHFDRNDRTRLKGVGLNYMIPFGPDRHTTPGRRGNIRWSFEHLPLGAATSVRSDHESASADPMLVTVDQAVYDAAWRLTGTDRRKDVIPQHYLLLRERTGGDDEP